MHFRFLLSCIFLFMAAGAQSRQLLDRIVIEVSSVSYSQRQIELFYAVFNSISDEQHNNFRPLQKDNWLNTVEQFKRFMLIEQEAHRLGSYLPSQNMIDKAYEVYQQRLMRDGGLQELHNKLKANESSIKKSIISVLRVASFLRSKQTRDNPSDNDLAYSVDFSNTSWFMQLEDRAIVRYMEGGQTYMSIRSL